MSSSSPSTAWAAHGPPSSSPTLFAREAARVDALGIRTVASAHSPLITGANVDAAQQKLLRLTTGPETALPTQVDLDAMLAALDPAAAGAGRSPVGVAAP